MENQSELFSYVISVFERLSIPYFVTGSFASIYYGEYRTTADIDIVADLRIEHVVPLIGAFPAPDFYVSEEAARDAIHTRFQFNILHMVTGLKIDVIIFAGDEFDNSRQFRLRRIEAAPNLDAWFASAEDVILKKLVYFQEGGSDKHLRDIAGILRVSGKVIDRTYIREWTEKLGVMRVWERVVSRVDDAS